MSGTTATAEMIPLFPTAILVAQMPEIDNQKLAQEIRNLRDADDRPHALISGNAFSSYRGARDLHLRPAFQPLMAAVRERLLGYVRAIGVDMERSEMLMVDCWTNIQQPGSQVLLHRHPNSLVSGAYYIEAAPDAGRIIFETPLEAHRMSDFPRYAQPTAFNAMNFSVEPAPGKLVLFPSWLGHRTEVNRSSSERIVISFNTSARLRD